MGDQDMWGLGCPKSGRVQELKDEEGGLFPMRHIRGPKKLTPVCLSSYTPGADGQFHGAEAWELPLPLGLTD